MNKVFTINLGGTPFTIDEDAYEHLDRYLKAIHLHFKASEGYEEITGDIEARLAELFIESLNSRKIVTIKDVKYGISIMGRPEEFGASSDIDDEETYENSHSDSTKRSFQPGKRLFRDMDDSLVGGVAAGISAYLGIADPLWVRIAFVVLTFTSGFGFLVYGILWAIVPEATSAADRLAMKGEPINFSNIGKIIEEELENIGEKVSEFGDEISSKKKVEETPEMNSNKVYRKGYL